WTSSGSADMDDSGERGGCWYSEVLTVPQVYRKLVELRTFARKLPGDFRQGGTPIVKIGNLPLLPYHRKPPQGKTSVPVCSPPPQDEGGSGSPTPSDRSQSREPVSLNYSPPNLDKLAGLVPPRGDTITELSGRT